MTALILNSGLGSRMGMLTAEQPKCMTEISARETILSRQLQKLADNNVQKVVITTGAFESELIRYVRELDLPLDIKFVSNPDYRTTNYIYSIYMAREFLDDDIILMHGDLVFENGVIDLLVQTAGSCMVVSSTAALPQKDFKAVIKNGRIEKVGVEFFDSALTAQPLYKISAEDWRKWLSEIIKFCERGEVKCYAEKAFNKISTSCNLKPLDVRDMLCNEIDTPEDLTIVSARLKEIENRTVYLGFGTDIVHSGHIKIIKRAQRLGKVIIGVLSDEAVASYTRVPLLSFDERKELLANIAGIYKVVEQKTLSYRNNLERYRPNFVVHGDDWRTGNLKSIREEVVEVLASYGGRLVEFPYSGGEKYRLLNERSKAEFSLPDIRRAQLKKILGIKGTITAVEVHNGLTGLIAEKTVVNSNNAPHQFDAMWISSLCDSTSKGKPDIELVDLTSRLRTVEDIMEVTTKPIIFDGDTGGLKEHFVYTVRTLERVGVSMIIIEDKVGLKKNSLFGTEVKQTQDTIENFCDKIATGKSAQKTADFMICARIESLILERGMDDAITRARAFVGAGADAIMIHSRKKNPDEIFAFAELFRETDKTTTLVVVPTSFNTVTEDEFKVRGFNVIIYANQLIRAAVPAMTNAAKSILEHRRAKECDEFCMPFKEIIRLIPEEL